MAIKKSKLYNRIWKSCDELRGGMDSSQYKDYVLILLFIKYISDKHAGKKDTLIEIPEGASFNDMVKLKGKPGIGDEINKKIIAPIAKANGLDIDVDFDDDTKLGKGKEMVDRLTNLIAIFEHPDLDFSKNKAEGDDILGDAYEYLMRKFATESGKSKGNFYTPAEVSRILAKVIRISQVERQDQTIYDPTCGSGSLLLKAADETEIGITIYGQEMDNATATLAKMNMFIHNREQAEIWSDNTLSKPYWTSEGKLKTFDFVVANPPFSNKSWSNGFAVDKGVIQDPYNRFAGYGIPPVKNGDYTFLLHMIKSLKSTGKAAVILPHGVLFRGNVEADIREKIIKRGYIKGIIGLPPNLFYGTGIPACIIVLDKENAQTRKGIFMIDASKGFYKDGNKNRLRAQDIHKIVDVFNKQDESDLKYARMVPISEISNEKNEYNLNIPRYIDNQEDEDIQDIEAHLLGDIPNKDVEALGNYWGVCPSLKNVLFTSSKRKEYSVLKVEKAQIKSTIYEHTEFINFSKKVDTVFRNWQKKNVSVLKNLKIGLKPKEFIVNLSEGLLAAFSKIQLIDKYDVYQHLMEYWEGIMQDDVYFIGVNGWKAETYRILVENQKKKMVDKGWTCDLVPKELVINKYFSTEKKNIEDLESEQENTSQQMQTLVEENSGEDDLFEEVKSESGNITKKELSKRVKEIQDDPNFADELKVLNEYSILLVKQVELKKKIKETSNDLDKKLLEKYKIFTEDEIKILVVDDKWMAKLENSVMTEMNRISQALTGRIKELAERYETPMPKLVKDVENKKSKVEDHLKKMGFKW